MTPQKTASPVRQCARLEPSLDEIFDEPIVRRMMARDGVTELALRRLIEQVRERLGGSEVTELETCKFPLPD